MTVEVRAAREEETPEIAGLIDRHAQQVFGESDMSEAEIRHWFSLPRVWILAAERDGRLCGYLDGLIRVGESVNELYVCALDAETARALLTAAEERVGGGVLRVVSQGADPVLPGVLGETGWRPLRNTFQMRIELDGDLPEPVWPEGIAVRPFRRGEERRVYEANNVAFAGDWYFEPFPFEEWYAFHTGRPGHDPSLWWLTEEGDKLAGYSLNSWHFSGDPRFGRIGSLGVLPAWRRRGLGEALLRHSFRDFRERGATRVGLGVDAENVTGAVRLYERVGMHVHRRNDTYEKTL